MKRSKSSLLAWALFAIITAFAFFSIARDLADRTAGDNLFNTIGDLLFSLVAVEFAFLAALIISRQPRNRIAWLMMLFAIMIVPDFLVRSYLEQFPTAPAEPTVSLLLAVYINSLSWLWVSFLLLFIILLFPDGRPPSPRWRWVILLGLGVIAFNSLGTLFSKTFTRIELDDWTITNPIGFLSTDDPGIISVIWFAAMASFFLLCAAAPFVRYRRGTGVQRQQIKWLFYAGGLFVLTFLPWTIRWDSGTLLIDVWGVLAVLSVTAIPVAIAIAILRYRLYDIDVIIRKTLLYGALTGLLALVYFGSVILLQALVEAITGSTSPIVIVISTLLIAALFTPLRRRLQRTIDRRFFRQKYNAQQVLAQFAETARDEVELETLTAELLRVTHETVQPESVSFWLRERQS